jgi:hypothetical protein
MLLQSCTSKRLVVALAIAISLQRTPWHTAALSSEPRRRRLRRGATNRVTINPNAACFSLCAFGHGLLAQTLCGERQ